MQTKIKSSLNQINDYYILKNSNFLNNQNYVINKEFNKKLELNLYYWKEWVNVFYKDNIQNKKYSIFFNINFFVSILFIILFLLLYFIWIKEFISSILLILYFSFFVIFIIFLNILYKIKIYFSNKKYIFKVFYYNTNKIIFIKKKRYDEIKILVYNYKMLINFFLLIIILVSIGLLYYDGINIIGNFPIILGSFMSIILSIFIIADKKH